VAGYALQLVFRENEDDPKRAWSYLRRYSMLAVVCSMATFLNPYGYRLHIHLAKYVNASFIMQSVDEFQSPSFRGEHMVKFEILLFAGLALVGLLLAKRRFVEALLILFWAQSALSAA